MLRRRAAAPVIPLSELVLAASAFEIATDFVGRGGCGGSLRGTPAAPALAPHLPNTPHRPHTHHGSPYPSSCTTHPGRAAKDSFWARLWDNKPARWLARVVATGVRVREIPADRPTEVAIAMSAEALFAELPKETRRALSDFPQVVQRLEARVRALRAELAIIDSGMGAAAEVPAGGAARTREELVSEMRAMRESGQALLTQVVTALETLRLDLLRLRLGAITIDGLTTDLGVARGLGGEAQRIIEAKREVERAVAPISPRPA